MRRAWLAAAVALAACEGGAAIVRAPDEAPRSNVRRADYVGPEVCGECHEDQHEAWAATAHAAMTRLAGDDAVIGDFDGAALAIGGRRATFSRDGDAYVMIVDERRFRVTRTIGSRHLQEYVGVEDGGAVEVRLPFGWWPRAGGWSPQAAFDSWLGPDDDPFAVDETPWAARCAWCHNTYPFELRAGRAVGHGFEARVALSGAPDSGGVLPLDQLVTVGISCESCHLGGRDHAERDLPIAFAPTSPDLAAPVASAGRRDPAICAQCHSTPAPRLPNGAAIRNSSEALDLAASPCSAAATCIDCHDPHQGGVRPDVDAVCAGCHADRATPAHTRHAAVACVDCHMPRIVEGISRFVRSHRISSPTDGRVLAFGAPNACNLCHLDRSLGWTLDALAAGWGARPDPGDAPREVPLGPAWLAGPSKTVRITAAAAYARAGDRAALPLLYAALDDEVPFYRTWMRLAVDELRGAPLTRAEYDPLAPASTRAAQVDALRRCATRPRACGRPGSRRATPAGSPR